MKKKRTYKTKEMAGNAWKMHGSYELGFMTCTSALAAAKSSDSMTSSALERSLVWETLGRSLKKKKTNTSIPSARAAEAADFGIMSVR